jgi:hypothetical protein
VPRWSPACVWPRQLMAMRLMPVAADPPDVPSCLCDPHPLQVLSGTHRGAPLVKQEAAAWQGRVG